MTCECDVTFPCDSCRGMVHWVLPKGDNLNFIEAMRTSTERAEAAEKPSYGPHKATEQHLDDEDRDEIGLLKMVLAKDRYRTSMLDKGPTVLELLEALETLRTHLRDTNRVKGSQMFERDVDVIEAAERLTDKWRAFQEGDTNEDPDSYAVALEKAVDARRESLKPMSTEPTPTPSITVGTQVRLTGVVRAEKTQGQGDVMVDVGCHVSIPLGVGGMCICVPADALEVIRQPFKRGEVVYPKGEQARPDTEWMIVADEQGGQALAVVAKEGWKVVKLETQGYERRP